MTTEKHSVRMARFEFESALADFAAFLGWLSNEQRADLSGFAYDVSCARIRHAYAVAPY